MKLLIILIVAVSCSMAVKGQTNDIFKRKPWEEFKLKKVLPDSLTRLYSVPLIINEKPYQDKGVLKFPLRGTFIGKNNNGDEIYAMSTDHMPCLVPGNKYVDNMPGAKTFDSNKKDVLLYKKRQDQSDKDKQDK